MAETKRVMRPVDALDTAGDHMAEMLRRTDELLAEWSRFGAAVREQVEREANQIGNAVGDAVEGAVRRATETSVDRALADQIGAKLAALSTELSRVETRAKAASRAITDQRRSDRTILYALGGAVLIANGLLVALLLREPPASIAPEPVPVVVPPAAAPAPVQEPATRPAQAKEEAKAEAPPDTKLFRDAKPEKTERIPVEEPAKPPANKGVKLGPPTGRGQRKP